MGLIEHIKCKQCGEGKDVFTGTNEITPTICNACEKKNNDRNRKEYFEILDSLSIEERIRKIEIWIYDNDSQLKEVIRSMERRF